ncbi:hypothetical protein B0I35DRAFT_146296 [Stachybotrys elegans]|uniref:Uncharacterized protein n=1 Tax=Stachybotrys elegans TaxID=80388 RepID=A0A8K0WJY2_9HYPO|nr:hypothetical protein B0I35DRAFT_146296 [Stachybotrys elegans]
MKKNKKTMRTMRTERRKKENQKIRPRLVEHPRECIPPFSGPLRCKSPLSLGANDITVPRYNVARRMQKKKGDRIHGKTDGCWGSGRNKTCMYMLWYRPQ